MAWSTPGGTVPLPAPLSPVKVGAGMLDQPLVLPLGAFSSGMAWIRPAALMVSGMPKTQGEGPGSWCHLLSPVSEGCACTALPCRAFGSV